MLTELSSELADAVADVAPSVGQVHGRRRPASGLVVTSIIVTLRPRIGTEAVRRALRRGLITM